ncbi:amino acid permease [Legionella waltersii]|uniref:Amino acid transporter PotE n=1 Tax=Legionella waltersii TaxID=66969 RepID=A0A0W1A5C3_9GAMM|nr:amino acid permease [Legionella waltersii]KTD76516.1 amino acid transporter PotE [Legionella waltersii]SNU93882.1 basic amino acid/polyamine antiporter, APA family [Legionella waltersii]
MDLFRKKDVTGSLEHESHLTKCLTLFDLTFLGVGAIIGAGIFVLTGIVAATLTGPSIIFSYVVAGFACAFAALSYAELAASVGGCGSAYGYAYAGFGELIAWIVGWDLLLEYSISVAAVSVGWSGYANDFLVALGLHVPSDLLHGPLDGGHVNILAISIISILTGLLIIGVKSSSRFNNAMVLIKLLVIFVFIAVAFGEVKLENWSTFMPFGWSGVMKGASIIFFAYIGFDAVSTAAEEAINPQKDLPRGIIFSLAICTVIYMVVSLLLTGIAHYSTMNVPSPISHVLLNLGYKTVAGLVGIGAIAGLTTVMLVLFYGLTRVFLAMSRDGLLPRLLSKTNEHTHTPIRIILISGIIMASLASVAPIGTLAELVNIGTLFAFILVCGGVLYMRYTFPDMERPFKTPLMPYIPILGILSCLYLVINLPLVTLIRFLIWMAVGMIIYFAFGRTNSTLNADVSTKTQS